MEELLNERYSTSEMPQVRGKFFRAAQPLPQLRHTPCVTERPDAGTDAQYGQGDCGL